MIRLLLPLASIITFSIALVIWKEVQGFVIIQPFSNRCLTSIIKMSEEEQGRPVKKVKVEEANKLGGDCGCYIVIPGWWQRLHQRKKQCRQTHAFGICKNSKKFRLLKS